MKKASQMMLVLWSNEVKMIQYMTINHVHDGEGTWLVDQIAIDMMRMAWKDCYFWLNLNFDSTQTLSTLSKEPGFYDVKKNKKKTAFGYWFDRKPSSFRATTNNTSSHQVTMHPEMYRLFSSKTPDNSAQAKPHPAQPGYLSPNCSGSSQSWRCVGMELGCFPSHDDSQPCGCAPDTPEKVDRSTSAKSPPPPSLDIWVWDDRRWSSPSWWSKHHCDWSKSPDPTWGWWGKGLSSKENHITYNLESAW